MLQPPDKHIKNTTMKTKLTSLILALTASFAYDGLGRRAQTTINSVLTQYRYDG